VGDSDQHVAVDRIGNNGGAIAVYVSMYVCMYVCISVNRPCELGLMGTCRSRRYYYERDGYVSLI
jgi:hypothetical protein